MQTVAEWKSGTKSGNNTGGLVSVSEWKKTQSSPSVQQQLPVVPVNNGFLSNLSNKVSQYAQSSADTVIPFGNAILNPLDTLKKLPGVFISPFMAGIKKASTPVPNGNVITDVANLFSGVAQSLFSPVTGAFTISEQIPGLKQVADILAVPVNAVGIAGSFSTGKIVDVLPISQKSKDIIKKPLQDAGSLVAQVAIGGRVMGEIAKRTSKGLEITPKIAKEIVQKVQKETPSTNLSTVADWKAQGKPTTPVRPIEKNKPTVTPKTTTEPKQPKNDVTFVPTESTFGVAKSLKKKAIRDKMIYAFDKRVRNLPVGEKRIKSEDIKKTAEYVISNPEEAFKVAMGEKRPPGNMLASDILAATVDYAHSVKRVDLVTKLINESKLNETFRRAGQEIQGLAQLNPAAKALNNIKKSREAKVVNYKKQRGVVITALKSEGKKVHLSKSELSWDKFLKEVVC